MHSRKKFPDIDEIYYGTSFDLSPLSSQERGWG
jgi:hypothetical protein